MRILSSSQSFGYGPSSKLVTLAKWLKPNGKFYIDFLGDDVSLTYVLQNSVYFNKIIEYKGEYPNPKNYDLVVSVMNPYIVIWAWINNIKSIYVDSLFWFWNWDESRFTHLESIIEELRSVNNIDEAWALVKDISPHDMQYIAYKLTNLSLVQKFSFEKISEENVDKFRKSLKVNYIGPIVDINKKKDTKIRNKIVISLSGLLSPLNREKDALRYSTLVMNLLDEVIGELPENIEVFLTTNPNVITEIRPINERINVVSFSNNAFLEILNETILLFAPVGITTLYESLTYNVPIYFLPEQHDGHYKNYLMLTDNGKEKESFPELLFNTRISRTEEKDPDKEILAIQTLVKKGAQNLNEPTLREMKNDLKSKALLIVNNDEERARILKKQQSSLSLKQDSQLDFEKYVHRVLNSELNNNQRKERIGILSDPIETLKINIDYENVAEEIGKKSMNVITLSDGNLDKLVKFSKSNGSKLFIFSQYKNLHEHREVFPNIDISEYDKVYFLGSDLNNLILNFVESLDKLIVFKFNERNLMAILAALQLGKTVFCTDETIEKTKGIISTNLSNIRDFIT